MLDLGALPRTIALVRAGDDYGCTLNAAAASAVAAFVARAWVPAGLPVAVMVDQTKLPGEEAYLCTADWREVVEAIKGLVVRGAPAIGIAGATALALRASEFCYAVQDMHREDAEDFDRVFVIDEAAFDPELYRAGLSFAARMIGDARPTAVNLSCEVGRALSVALELLDAGAGPDAILDALCRFTVELIDEDEQRCRCIGQLGADLLPEGCCILTHCNAGSLACAFYGTALGVAYTAAEQGKLVRVYADETRPVGQGARLTAWELARAGVPVTLICDDMAASVMVAGLVDAVVVGADRIARNGDVANKIGTLGVAVLAHHFGIPFYVAAPVSTFDAQAAAGADIQIEQRAASEVLAQPLEGVEVLNPAFDVTPAALISALITERGVCAPSELAMLLGGADAER